MAKDDGKPWNTIIGSVSSALIVAAILYFVPSVWAAIKFAASWLWSAVTFSVSLPVWLLVLIALALVPTVVQIIGSFKTTTSNEKTWRDYTEDKFHGMVWRWGYGGPFANRIDNVWCYCPTDATCLVYSQIESYGENRTRFICETCQRQFDPIPGDLAYITASIERQIDRKIRSKEWKAIVGVDTEKGST